MKYLELINQSSEESAKADNELCAAEAKLNVEAEILDLRKKLASQMRNLEEAKRSRAFDIKAIYQLQCQIDLNKRAIEHHEQILKDLF